jgi:hypothetical protein
MEEFHNLDSVRECFLDNIDSYLTEKNAKDISLWTNDEIHDLLTSEEFTEWIKETCHPDEYDKNIETFVKSFTEIIIQKRKEQFLRYFREPLVNPVETHPIISNVPTTFDRLKAELRSNMRVISLDEDSSKIMRVNRNAKDVNRQNYLRSISGEYNKDIVISREYYGIMLQIFEQWLTYLTTHPERKKVSTPPRDPDWIELKGKSIRSPFSTITPTKSKFRTNMDRYLNSFPIMRDALADTMNYSDATIRKEGVHGPLLPQEMYDKIFIQNPNNFVNYDITFENNNRLPTIFFTNTLHSANSSEILLPEDEKDSEQILPFDGNGFMARVIRARNTFGVRSFPDQTTETIRNGLKIPGILNRVDRVSDNLLKRILMEELCKTELTKEAMKRFHISSIYRDRIDYAVSEKEGEDKNCEIIIYKKGSRYKNKAYQYNESQKSENNEGILAITGFANLTPIQQEFMELLNTAKPDENPYNMNYDMFGDSFPIEEFCAIMDRISPGTGESFIEIKERNHMFLLEFLTLLQQVGFENIIIDELSCDSVIVDQSKLADPSRIKIIKDVRGGTTIKKRKKSFTKRKGKKRRTPKRIKKSIHRKIKR